MSTIRKAQKGEIEKIIDVANKSFRPIRNRHFDFKNAVPFIYSSKEDFSEIHYVLEENNKIVSLVGNLIREITIGKKKYKFSNIGTVCTLPKHRGKGNMKELMKRVEQENKDTGVVFSFLTGNRKRYNHFGYEASGFKFEYSFAPNVVPHLKNDKDILLQKVNKEDFEILFDLYKKHSPFCLRQKEDFDLYFLDNRITLEKIVFEDKIIGYFAMKQNTILELILTDVKFINALIIKLFERPYSYVTFRINPLRKKQVLHFEKIANNKQMVESNIYKIYDTKAFIEMMLELNKNIVKFPDCSTCIKVDNEVFKISITDGKSSVKKSKATPVEEFTKTSFVRYCMSIITYDHTPRIFPLLFDIDDIDMF